MEDNRAPNTPNTPDDTGAGGGNGKWYDSLPDDLKGNETLKGYDGIESLAKAHLAAHDEAAALKKQIEEGKPVIPDKPEAYELPSKFDGMPDELTGEMASQISRAALAAGIPKDAAAKLFNAVMAEEAQSLKDEAAAIERAKTETVTALKKEFGDKYDEKLNGALLRCTQIAGKSGIEGEAFKSFLNETGIGDNPTFIRFAISLADLISPDIFEQNQGRGAGGKSDAEVLFGTPT